MMTYAVCELPGGLLASGDVSGIVRIWSLATGACLRTIPPIGRSYNIREILLVNFARWLVLSDGEGASYHDVKPAP